MGAPANVPIGVPEIDVPEGDAAEQARELREPGQAADGGGPASVEVEVDEFDAVEQSLVVEDDEDDYR
jgi:hypothetical protein